MPGRVLRRCYRISEGGKGGGGLASEPFSFSSYHRTTQLLGLVARHGIGWRGEGGGGVYIQPSGGGRGKGWREHTRLNRQEGGGLATFHTNIAQFLLGFTAF